MRYQDNPLIRARYKTAQWQKVRKMKIQSVNGLCEKCLRHRIYKEGKIVHHKIHITDENYQDDNIMYNLDNLEFLCAECHLLEHQNKPEYYFDENGDLCNGEK